MEENYDLHQLNVLSFALRIESINDVVVVPYGISVIANVTLSGGTAPYTIDWIGPAAYTADTLNINNLCATIGPCITEKNYEVQKDFKDKFLKKNKKNSVFFKNRKNKTYFSLNNYVYNQLKQKGIKNIELINKDTFDKKNNFFSARRSIQNNENDFGRNISIIMIK